MEVRRNCCYFSLWELLLDQYQKGIQLFQGFVTIGVDWAPSVQLGQIIVSHMEDYSPGEGIRVGVLQ